MIRINEIALSLDEDESQLKKKAAKILKINEKYIKKYTIYKKSIDARKKDDVHFTYSLDVNISLDEEQIASKCKSNKVQIVKPYVYELPENKRVSKFRPVVVGFGPAGMFAGLILALSGLKPILKALRAFFISLRVVSLSVPTMLITSFTDTSASMAITA